MVALAVLVFPLPLSVRRHAFQLYRKIYESESLRTTTRVGTFLVLIMFVDSLTSTWKIQSMVDGTKSSYQQRSDLLARRFYSQRNIYITGAVLFLSLAIPTVFTILRRLIKYDELKMKALDAALIDKRVKELTLELERKQRDLDTLQKQKKGLERSYDDLADKVNEKTSKESSTIRDKKRD